MPPRPIEIEDATKSFVADVEKTLPPEETVRRLRARLGRLDLDVLSETRRLDRGRLGIPVYASVCGRDARRVIGKRRQMGKGATPAQAEASAVMELAERFSFFSFMADGTRFTTATMASLGTEPVDADLLSRSLGDRGDDRPAALEALADLPLRWVWATDMAAGRARRVPFDWFYALNAYNGPAAGNCLAEAVCQGICEVVERDVSARVAAARRPLPAVDADTVQDPVGRALLDRFRATGVSLFLSDFSLDTGIPTVGALAWDPATFPARSEIVWTAGTATSPARALSRALTEVAQLAGDFDSGATFEASGLPKFTAPEQAAFVTRPPGARPLDALPDLSHPNLRVEAERLVAALGARGMPVLVVDVTHPRLLVPAVYTIVPGARFRERAASLDVGMLTAKLIAETRPVEEALSRLTAFDRRLPGRYYIQFYLGTGHLSAGRPDAALDHLRRALELAPPAVEAADILVYTGLALKETGRWEEALPVLERAAALDPDRTDVHNLMGVCHFKRGAHREAVACFERVLAIDPGSAMDHANIGVNQQALGNREAAVAAYRTALALDPTIEFALRNLLELDGGD